MNSKKYRNITISHSLADSTSEEGAGKYSGIHLNTTLISQRQKYSRKLNESFLELRVRSFHISELEMCHCQGVGEIGELEQENRII